MNERVLETAHLEALLMAAPPARVSTVHFHRGFNGGIKKSLSFERLFLT
jgi:hypothetical protein